MNQYQYMTRKQAVEFLRQQGYPLPPAPGSAYQHLVRLGNRGLVNFTATAGGYRRYTEADLLEFVRNVQRNDTDR